MLKAFQCYLWPGINQMCLGLAVVSSSKHWLETAWNVKGSTAFANWEYFNTQQVVDISWKTLEGKHYLELVQTHEIHLSSLYFRWLLLRALFLDSHWEDAYRLLTSTVFFPNLAVCSRLSPKAHFQSSSLMMQHTKPAMMPSFLLLGKSLL